jgi:hypothetical protein
MEDLQNPRFTRGKFKYDNSLLTEDLLMAEHSGVLKSNFLNDQQNKDIHENFELVEMVLDKYSVNYLAVLRKK